MARKKYPQEIYEARIRPRLDAMPGSNGEKEKAMGLPDKIISNWNNAGYGSWANYLYELADYLDVSVEYLRGETDDPNPTRQEMILPSVASDVVSFPVIGTVAAGYNKPAYENWTGDTIEVPTSYLHGRDPQDYFVLRVDGDSMYPAYQDGDHVLVLRQTTLDYSGQVAVVVYDGENGSLKAVDFTPGADRMTLRPLNTSLPPRHIYGEDINQVFIQGVAKMIIREVE